MEKLNKLAIRTEKHPWTKKLIIMEATNSLKKYFHSDRAPQNWGFEEFTEFIKFFVEFNEQQTDKTAYIKKLRQQRYEALLMAAMHFQDNYNYELDRTRHCVILYGAPNRRFYPFCSWNSGPCHRYAVEKTFSRPFRGKKQSSPRTAWVSKEIK